MEEERVFGRHVFMLPWIALGHIIPYAELAKRLCDRGFRVHFCSTPTNLNSIKNRLQQKAYREIQTVKIHLPSIPGLPSNCESTSSLPSHLMPLLKEAFNSCKPELTTIFQTLKPDFLIHDILPPWASFLAYELGIHAIGFTPVNAAFYTFFFSLLKGSNFDNLANSPLSKLKLHEYESQKVDRSMQQNSKEMEELKGTTMFNKSQEHAVALKTARFLEPGLIDYAHELTGRKVIPLGTLVSYQKEISSQSQNYFTDWLETKRSSSVVLVSFGSEYFMCKEEITEIAFGLELSNQSFLWVIRLLQEEEEEKTIERVLPVGFLERVTDRALVVNGWAPQMAILSHPSTGGFLTHCGWGSACEGMACGVPLIALPMDVDQPLNAKLVTRELGLGVEIEREENGGFKREKVAEGIKKVMVQGEESREIRRKAKEMAERMRDEGEEGIDELVGEMERMLWEP